MIGFRQRIFRNEQRPSKGFVSLVAIPLGKPPNFQDYTIDSSE